MADKVAKTVIKKNKSAVYDPTNICLRIHSLDGEDIAILRFTNHFHLLFPPYIKVYITYDERYQIECIRNWCPLPTEMVPQKTQYKLSHRSVRIFTELFWWATFYSEEIHRSLCWLNQFQLRSFVVLTGLHGQLFLWNWMEASNSFHIGHQIVRG